MSAISGSKQLRVVAVLARREVPHPGAQLRPVDHDGRWITCFPPTPGAGNCPTETAAPPPRPRRRPHPLRQDTGLANLPLHDAASNAIWLPSFSSPTTLLTPTLTPLSGPLRVAEPKTLRLRLLAIAGRLTRSGRRTQLRLDRRWPWAATVTAAVARCAPSRPRLTTPPLPRRPGTMVTDRLRSEATFSASKLITSPGHRRLCRCSPYLTPAMCCKPIRSSP
jgi:Transposase DDE domain group 1